MGERRTLRYGRGRRRRNWRKDARPFWLAEAGRLFGRPEPTGLFHLTLKRSGWKAQTQPNSYHPVENIRKKPGAPKTQA
jgi:hypothetical protein